MTIGRGRSSFSHWGLVIPWSLGFGHWTFSDPRPFLVFDHVQAALLLLRPGPAAGAVVAALLHGGGARPATDARVALVVKRVVRHVVVNDELPDVVLGPPQERVHFHEVELGVPLDHASGMAVLGLVAANSADPRGVSLNRPAQGHDLAVVAALVRAVDVERAAVLALVLGDGRVRADQFDGDPVPLAEALPQLESLGELVAGVQVDHPDGWFDLGEHVEDGTAFRPESRCHHQLRVKPADGPGEDFLWGSAVQLAARGGNLVVRRSRRIHKLRPVYLPKVMLSAF